MKKIEVLAGDVYGKLTITGEGDPHITPKGQACRRVAYVCSCGVEGEAILVNIRRGNTKSCGCLKIGAATKHGKCGTKLYAVYRNMLDRCNNSKAAGYAEYGGRGIRVCEEWMVSLDAFYKWALEGGYEEGLSIERVDVNGDYTPTNCTWITMAEQALNKRMLKTNTSGITGVSYRTGEGKWVAIWWVGGKQKAKSFSVRKYGEDEAKQMAISKRLEMEKFLGIINNDGRASYDQLYKKVV